jgi:hypothetical protein
MGAPAAISTPPGDAETYALMRRVATGDPLAFEALYRHYTPWLMGYLQARLGEGACGQKIGISCHSRLWRRALTAQRGRNRMVWRHSSASMVDPRRHTSLPVPWCGRSWCKCVTYAVSTCRRERAPNRSPRDSASSLPGRTQRSAEVLRVGDCGGSGTRVTPAASLIRVVVFCRSGAGGCHGA